MILTMMMSTFERRRGVATPMIDGETETSNATVITDHLSSNNIQASSKQKTLSK
jgi:hypothetical protein